MLSKPMIFRRYGVLNAHKQKGKTMWIKLEDKLEYVNLAKMGCIEVYEADGKYKVGLSRGFGGYSSFKSFEYKEDAAKYLDKLIAKLEGEDDEDEASSY